MLPNSLHLIICFCKFTEQEALASPKDWVFFVWLVRFLFVGFVVGFCFVKSLFYDFPVVTAGLVTEFCSDTTVQDERLSQVICSD